MIKVRSPFLPSTQDFTAYQVPPWAGLDLIFTIALQGNIIPFYSCKQGGSERISKCSGCPGSVLDPSVRTIPHIQLLLKAMAQPQPLRDHAGLVLSPHYPWSQVPGPGLARNPRQPMAGLHPTASVY